MVQRTDSSPSPTSLLLLHHVREISKHYFLHTHEPTKVAQYLSQVLILGLRLRLILIYSLRILIFSA